MLEVARGLIKTLNMIEVKGKNNLALLYNAIDTLEQIEKSFTGESKNETVTEYLGREDDPDADSENEECGT